MSEIFRSDRIPGLSLEEEKSTLTKIIKIADENLKRTKESVESLANELNELKEVYDVSDKEGLAQWFNTDARFKQVRQDLLRSEHSRNKPYFGRIDFSDCNHIKNECYYIGKSVIAKDAAKPLVIDWRAPIASVYYEKSLGACTYSVKGEGAFEIDLLRKRTYEIEDGKLKDYFDSEVVANDELLTKYLAKSKKNVLSEIIATIQQEQNEIIRKKPQHNMIVQGGAGSGKTTVAMHRISYILYNYDLEFKPKDFYIIGSNQILLNYITGILPDLDVYGASQMTMEQLFIRLLYEDWDKDKYTTKKINKGDEITAIKGSYSWFHDLENYCKRYEWEYIPRNDVYLEKTHHLLMSRSVIERLLEEFYYLSLPDKIDKLTEHLIASLENEMFGKYYSYPAQEQKTLKKFYQNYFGKREWNGSIFDLYDKFLMEQNEKGKHVSEPGTEFDVYDLSALAYLYKRIKETEVIQEASHVVIDEAQDFGMMVYGALKYCLSKCTYTIMGDVSQNISFHYGLTDWEELRSLMLPGEFDYFGLLKKSYRNTIEISNFATSILKHGNFPIYPVEPIIRHGKEVRITESDGENQLIIETINTITNWKKQGYETIAVICRDEEESKRVSDKIKKKIVIHDINSETDEFGSGVMVLPIEYSKGLEFDVVLLFNANNKNYPATDGYTKLLYVATTRALHELVVLYSGKLTDLIATTVPEERSRKYLVDTKITISKKQEVEPKTKKEIELEQALEGHKEMELRNQIGPRRIEVQKISSEKQPKKNNTGLRIGRKVDYYASALGHTPVSKVINKKEKQTEPVLSEFGTMPDNTSLKPLGHPNLNMSIRWVTGNKNFIELTCGCGVLRITPICENTVRVNFYKDNMDKLREIPKEITVNHNLKWNYREIRDKVEITTEKILVQVDKKTGALSFYTARGKLLLAENTHFPRQLGNAAKKQTWTYFDWKKTESMSARGNADSEWSNLNNTAKYISLGANTNRPACIMSNSGYQILIPSGTLVMCCTIPMYGPYLYIEGEKQVDYFLRTAL